ncbi:MAG: hypothetical protein ACK2T6_06420 [Anaerolineae bacterium]
MWQTAGEPRLSGFVAAAVVCLAVGLFGAPSVASAWGDTGVLPESGNWCGLTDDGGTIRFEVTGDKRYTQAFELNLTGQSVAVRESNLASRAQIKDSKFVLRGTTAAVDPGQRTVTPRQPGGPARCLVVPCRPTSARRTPNPQQPDSDILIRGTFEAYDSAAGSFKVGATVGYYTAWPARFGCP